MSSAWIESGRQLLVDSAGRLHWCASCPCEDDGVCGCPAMPDELCIRLYTSPFPFTGTGTGTADDRQGNLQGTLTFNLDTDAWEGTLCICTGIFGAKSDMEVRYSLTCSGDVYTLTETVADSASVCDAGDTSSAVETFTAGVPQFLFNTYACDPPLLFSRRITSASTECFHPEIANRVYTIEPGSCTSPEAFSFSFRLLQNVTFNVGGPTLILRTGNPIHMLAVDNTGAWSGYVIVQAVASDLTCLVQYNGESLTFEDITHPPNPRPPSVLTPFVLVYARDNAFGHTGTGTGTGTAFVGAADNCKKRFTLAYSNVTVDASSRALRLAPNCDEVPVCGAWPLTLTATIQSDCPELDGIEITLFRGEGTFGGHPGAFNYSGFSVRNPLGKRLDVGMSLVAYLGDPWPLRMNLWFECFNIATSTLTDEPIKNTATSLLHINNLEPDSYSCWAATYPSTQMTGDAGWETGYTFCLSAGCYASALNPPDVSVTISE